MLTKMIWIYFLYSSPINAQFDNDCGGIVHISDSRDFKTVSTPGYPHSYPGDISCQWTLQAPVGQRIELTFVDFDITGSPNCIGDFVSIVDPLRNDNHENKYCGPHSPPTMVSKADSILITFQSNEKGSCKGFNATFRTIEEIHTCGSKTQASEFTFISPNYPASVPEESLDCSLIILHGCDAETSNSDSGDKICQLRLEFEDFQLQPPVWGECKHDSFYVESSSPLPILCGNNKHNHMYVNVEGKSQTELTFLLEEIEYRLYHCYDVYNVLSSQSLQRLRRNIDANEEHYQMRQISTSTELPSSITTEILTTVYPSVALYEFDSENVTKFSTRRAWKIKVTRIPCIQSQCSESDASVNKAPNGCLQYFSEITGTIKSFNYGNLGCYIEDQWCDLKEMQDETDCDIVVGYTGHLNNLDYSICIESESGFCGIEYAQQEQFSISGDVFQASTNQPQTGDNACPLDFLWIPGAHHSETGQSSERFCGSQFGFNSSSKNVLSYSKPFVIRTVTDANEHLDQNDFMNQGFRLSFTQVPCMPLG